MDSSLFFVLGKEESQLLVKAIYYPKFKNHCLWSFSVQRTHKLSIVGFSFRPDLAIRVAQ